VRLLPHRAVDLEREVDAIGLAQLVRRHEPGPEHRVRIERLAKTAIFGPTYGHVGRNRIAGNDVERARFRDVTALAPDHDAEFDLVIGAAIRKVHRDALARTDERARRFEEQPGFIDARNGVIERDAGVGFGLGDVRFIVHGRANNLRRVDHRREKLYVVRTSRPRAEGGAFYPPPDRGQG